MAAGDFYAILSEGDDRTFANIFDVKTRYLLLATTVVSVGLCFFSANRATDMSIYTTAGVTCAIVATSISALCIALFSIKSMSLLSLTRACVPVLIVIVIASDSPSVLVTSALICTAVLHSLFYSEKFLSICTQDIGNPNEDMFLLSTPRSVTLWFFFTWSVVWATFVECIHLFGTGKTFLGIGAAIVGLIILGIFIAPQSRSMLRRCVIVPHGLVASDPITLTDVVLLPLSKIKSVEFIPRVSNNEKFPDTTFASLTTQKNIVAINLNDFTDSLIVRKGVNETERQNVNQLLFSVANASRLVDVFHKRFHHVEAPELSAAQEKMVEKELGIETAPRSDAKLPQWRTKK